MRNVGAITVAALILAGCDLMAPAQPDWVVNRLPLPLCGAIDQTAGERNVAAQECVLEAYEAGRGAEMITRTAEEVGRPVTSYLRVHENGTIEMFLHLVDAGQGFWERFRCERLIPAEEVDGPTEPDTVFVQDGCEQLPVP